MATKLETYLTKDKRVRTREVYRETLAPFDHQGRTIIVGLELGDVITLREKGRRKTFTLDIKAAYRYAVKLEVDRKRSEKMATRRARKKKTTTAKRRSKP